MNSRWIQFGYRFSPRLMLFLVMLIAVGGRLTWFARTLTVFGIVVNLFGAWSFDREWKHYHVGGNAYSTVVRGAGARDLRPPGVS